MNKLKMNILLSSACALVATAANASSVILPTVIDSAQEAPHAVHDSENSNQLYDVKNTVALSSKQLGLKNFKNSVINEDLKKHYTGDFLSLNVGTHYKNKDTTIGADVGAVWGGYEIIGSFVNGKFGAGETEGSMIDQTTYSLSVWKPFITGRSYDLSLGGSIGRTIFDSEQASSYAKSSSSSVNDSITSTYLSLRARSTVSSQLGMYAEANYNPWNNHEKFSSEDLKELHNKVTLKAGIDYTIAKGAQIGLNASVGTKFDTMYTASFKYMFK